jgi:hypothetical protein
VTAGVLIAFAMVLLVVRLRPYARDTMNFVASMASGRSSRSVGAAGAPPNPPRALQAQVSLWFFLFVALLLKVQVNGDAADSRLFNAIIVILTTGESTPSGSKLIILSCSSSRARVS